MLSFKSNRRARRIRLAGHGRVLVPALALSLAGCFHPLYGPTASGNSTVQEEMQAVVVDPIPDRLGHYLGNELIFAFNGSGTPGPRKYRLLVTPQERVQTPLIDTVTGRASAATVFIDADFRLIPAAGGDPIVKGTAYSSATYDRSSNRYANVRAARDAEIRNARVLADQIRTRVAAALATAS
jgi:LPS-assembly lipoprotein